MPEDIDHVLEELAPLLIGELCRLGYPPSAPESDDLLQETRLRLVKALGDRGKKIKFLEAYAKKVVLSVFISEVKKLAMERRLIDAARSLQTPIRDPGASQERSEDMLEDAVAGSMETLGAAKRRALELRLEGFTFDEIARLNGWSLRKACGVYYRGIRELRDRLAERGIHYEG